MSICEAQKRAQHLLTLGVCSGSGVWAKRMGEEEEELRVDLGQRKAAPSFSPVLPPAFTRKRGGRRPEAEGARSCQAEPSPGSLVGTGVWVRSGGVAVTLCRLRNATWLEGGLGWRRNSRI